MSQRRRNGSPTSSFSPVSTTTTGGGVPAGGIVGGAGGSGMNLLNRLVPMKATVPFQLKAQGQTPQQPRSAHGGGSPTHGGNGSSNAKCPSGTTSSLSRSPTRGVTCCTTVLTATAPLSPSAMAVSSFHASGSSVHVAAQSSTSSSSSSSSSSCRSSPTVISTGPTFGGTFRAQAQSPVFPSQQQTVVFPHLNTYNPYGSVNVGTYLGGLSAASQCYSPSQQLSWISDVSPGPIPPANPQQQPPLSASPSGSSRGRLVVPLPSWSSDQEQQQSPDRMSPSSPSGKGRGSVLGVIQRTSSLDALAGPYLSGQWPRDPAHSHSLTPTSPCMKDQATQTPSAWVEECQDKRSGLHQRSASWGSTDQLKEIAKLRQQLQRSKHSRHHRDKERKSPFNGNHTVINQSQTLGPRSALIAVPATRPAPRLRNSLEGLNQEIERLIIRDAADSDYTHTLTEVPDGRRAPPPHSLHSVDTQTPGNYSNSSSRSQSVSPTFPSVANDDSPGLHDNLLSDGLEKDVCPGSPRPNNSYMFMREPPEGCERVKVFDETPVKSQHVVAQVLCPDRNKVNFVPKSGSAFCLLRQPLLLPTPQEIGGLKGAPSPSASPFTPTPAPTPTPPMACPSSSPPPSSSSGPTCASCAPSVALVCRAEDNNC